MTPASCAPGPSSEGKICAAIAATSAAVAASKNSNCDAVVPLTACDACSCADAIAARAEDPSEPRIQSRRVGFIGVLTDTCSTFAHRPIVLSARLLQVVEFECYLGGGNGGAVIPPTLAYDSSILTTLPSLNRTKVIFPGGSP